MHEFSICENLVHAVLQEISQQDQPPAKVLQVKVVIGRLRQVVPDYLEFAYQTLSQDTLLQGSILEIEQLPIRLKCRHCGAENGTDRPVFQCPRCGSRDLETVAGMELYLESIEVESNDESNH